ncbi:unnamed protein product [Symbiodinium necroappetens]|uniref:Uncharacterized protein n=1 Tax=Symbiodinium necroappetens TaxID=1628268 RepID=A0A812RR34_9DINO|nr:unnamed protein product [Symbiodinium necroappetens]
MAAQDQMPDFMKTTKDRVSRNPWQSCRCRDRDAWKHHEVASLRAFGHRDKMTAERPMEKSASAPGLTQASQSLSSHSYSAAWATAGASSSRVTGRLASSPPTAEDLPQWLLIAEGRARIPAPPPKSDLSFPFKPQEPGKGGPKG